MAIREIIGLHKRLWFNNKRSSIICFYPCSCDLARMLISGESKVNTPKNKKNAPAAESGSKRRKRTRDKLIRLDDLIPEKDVKGGRQLLFGVTETTQRQTTHQKSTNRVGTRGGCSSPEHPLLIFRVIKKLTSPTHTRAGMRGGCSPQNNRRKLRD